MKTLPIKSKVVNFGGHDILVELNKNCKYPNMSFCVNTEKFGGVSVAIYEDDLSTPELLGIMFDKLGNPAHDHETAPFLEAVFGDIQKEYEDYKKGKLVFPEYLES